MRLRSAPHQSEIAARGAPRVCGSRTATTGRRPPSLASIVGHESVSRARVEPAPDGEWRGWVDGDGGCLEPGCRRPTEHDRRDLQGAIEALAVGTVVERHGAGIAPRFGDPARPEWYRESLEYPF